jgi:NADPH-ferrihemoprotein reductase
MIGPGTGVAPMRAFLQERSHQKRKGTKTGANILYFGCKKAEWDYLYQDEMEGWQNDGTLDELHIAFSRAQTHKVYVQHLLQQNSQETWDLIEQQNAYIYVCGAVQMGHDVGEVLQKIVTEHSDRTTGQAKAYMSKLAEQGRYVQELWA